MSNSSLGCVFLEVINEKLLTLVEVSFWVNNNILVYLEGGWRDLLLLAYSDLLKCYHSLNSYQAPELNSIINGSVLSTGRAGEATVTGERYPRTLRQCQDSE